MQLSSYFFFKGNTKNITTTNETITTGRHPNSSIKQINRDETRKKNHTSSGRSKVEKYKNSWNHQRHDPITPPRTRPI